MQRLTRQGTGRALVFLYATVCVACAPASPTSTSGRADSPTVVLLSMDGTRPADVSNETLPTLVALGKRGATAAGMIPVFPTNTFPNHVTLVTGVEPDRHGIVNNVFFDPEDGLFRYENEPGWIEVEPLWAIADRYGVVSASFHWIGSEGNWTNGHGPRYWKHFDRNVDEMEKVDQILEWIDRDPSSGRPRLITSWFRGADRDAHRDGPGAESARAALRRQDRALAHLVAELDRRNAFDSTILLIVSDHGMLPVADVIDLNAVFRESDIPAHAVGGGGLALVYAEGSRNGAGHAETIDRAIAAARAQGLRASRRGPSLDGFSTENPRFGDAFVLAPVGTAISSISGPPMRGSHGYHPDEPGMAALLVAVGAGIPAGTALPSVRTLDVAPTILTWLSIPPPEWMQGRPIAGLVTAESEPRSPDETDETR